MTTRQHLIERGLNPDLYHCEVDEVDNVATFFLFNLTGQLTGYQLYRPWSTDKKTNDPEMGRYYTYSKRTDVITSADRGPKGTRTEDGFFGLERCTSGGPLLVFEGIFKAAKAHNLGFDAIAVLTSDPKRMRPLFRIMRATRALYGVGDPDAAGEKLVRRVGRGKTSPVDFDEMSDEDALNFIKELTE